MVPRPSGTRQATPDPTTAASSPPRLPTRASQREVARRRVEQLALNMFSRQGFDAVTVEDICGEAGIAPATFYRYFGSKESIVFCYEEEFLAAAREIGESVDLQQDTLDQLRQILRRCMRFFEDQSDMLALRDQIVLPHAALLQRTLAIQRKFESSLAEALAARRQEGSATEASLDAAVCLLVLRLGLRAWRSDAGSDLEGHTIATFESLRTRLR